MKHSRMVAIVVVALALATTGLAGQQGGARDGSGPLIDTSQLVVFEGTVVQLVAGLGQGMPELEITTSANQALSFVLGPYWFLQASGFAAEAGDDVEVSAFACTTCESGYAVAKVVNATRAVTLVLRSEDGTPLWTASGTKTLRRQLGRAGSGTGPGSGGNGENGNGPGNGTGPGSGGQGTGPGQVGGCDVCEPPDLGQVQTFTGTVSAVDAGAGDGTPTVTLATTAGDVTFLISPYSILQRAAFALTVGQALEITAAPVEHDDVETWLALVIKDTATGLTVVLRDPATGLPPIGRGRR
ncbi:MAG: hypothetical protein AB2L07_03965 [Thermoanaerobaculaceae bacterium]